MFLTSLGRAVVTVALALLVLSVAVDRVALGIVGIGLLLGVCAAALRVGRDVAEVAAGRLVCRLAVEARPGRSTLHVGDGATFVLRLEARGGSTFHRVFVDRFAIDGVVAPERVTAGPPIPAGGARTLRIAATASRTGVHVAHGLMVHLEDAFALVAAESWFRLHLPFRVLPERLASAPLDRLPSRAGAIPPGGGLTDPRGREPTVELRELRDYRPGDSPRAVAWAATARRGKLVVRELERERPLHLRVLLDAGPGQRGGADAPRFERALAVTQALASSTLLAGGTFSLTSFDGAVLGRMENLRHRGDVARVVHHLEALHLPWRERDSDWTDDELAERVARYLRIQHGVSERGVGAGSGSGELLERVLAVQYREELEAWRVRMRAAGHGVDHASVMRSFACARGIAQPWRRSFEGSDRDSLLAELLREAGASRAPTPTVLLTDLGGLPNLRRVVDVAQLVARRGARLIVVLSWVPADAGEYEDSEHRAAVRAALEIAEAQRRRAQVRQLRAAGAEVIWAESSARATCRAVVHALRGPRAIRVPATPPSAKATRTRP